SPALLRRAVNCGLGSVSLRCPRRGGRAPRRAPPPQPTELRQFTALLMALKAWAKISARAVLINVAYILRKPKPLTSPMSMYTSRGPYHEQVFHKRTLYKAIKIYDGAHHGELICCLPGLGRDIGMEFLPEQFATTETCLSDMAEWIGARL
ncbi:unnamed protein product, partial [Polarella glacialis]